MIRGYCRYRCAVHGAISYRRLALAAASPSWQPAFVLASLPQPCARELGSHIAAGSRQLHPGAPKHRQTPAAMGSDKKSKKRDKGERSGDRDKKRKNDAALDAPTEQ